MTIIRTEYRDREIRVTFPGGEWQVFASVDKLEGWRTLTVLPSGSGSGISVLSLINLH